MSPIPAPLEKCFGPFRFFFFSFLSFEVEKPFAALPGSRDAASSVCLLPWGFILGGRGAWGASELLLGKAPVYWSVAQGDGVVGCFGCSMGMYNPAVGALCGCKSVMGRILSAAAWIYGHIKPYK